MVYKPGRESSQTRPGDGHTLTAGPATNGQPEAPGRSLTRFQRVGERQVGLAVVNQHQ